MAVTTTSRYESSYIHIAIVVLRVSPLAVRVQFDKEFHSNCLQRTLKSECGRLLDLKTKKRIAQSQWNLLFTRTAILKHWVNPFVSYCGDDKDILPIRMFCATHSDDFKQEDRIDREAKLIRDRRELFKNHKRKHRIIYDDIFFINGKDKNDLEINRLKSKLVEEALNQKSWGNRMPMAWIPLDLQMSEMRVRNVNIISKEALTTLNQRNEDLALPVKEIKIFLNVQHSLGKIVYIDQHILDNFIIVQPQSLVNILRSFITAEHFWPEVKELKGILCTLTNTGKIAKQDLLKLWSQEKFHQHMPSDDLKEFIIQILVHLDILVEPRHHRQEQESKVQSYLVPCIVKHRLPVTDFYVKAADKMICLSYTLLKSSIPAALSFKLIGAAINVWPLKKTQEGICLYHQAAILCIDGSNELYLLVEDDKVFVYLINKVAKRFISPNIASTVQECLTLTMTKVLEFYHKSFGMSLSTLDVSKAFEIEVGEWCTSGGGCYISVPELEEKTEWRCKNNKTHDKTYPRYWICNKKQVECDEKCPGLDEKDLELPPEEKHLFRLAKLITVDECYNLVIKLGLPRITWNDTHDTDRYDNTVKKCVALCKWKDLKYKQMSKPSFKELSDALAEDDRTHFLCQLFMEDVTVYGHMPRYNTFKTTIQEIACDHGYYMITTFASNRYRMNGVEHCHYKKSACAMEGMKIYDNGSTTEDRKCYCDYKNNFKPDLSLDPNVVYFYEKDNHCSMSECDLEFQEMNTSITVKIESNDKYIDDDNGILTNEVALHDQELEGKCEVALHDQELGGKCDLAVPHQELEGKGDIAVPGQELEGTCDISIPDQETEGKGDVAVHWKELEIKCDVDVPDEEINGGQVAVASADFELTLLCKLIRYHLTAIPPPTCGWGNRPLPGHLNEADDIERIRHLRNNLANNSDLEICDTDFSTHWTDLSEAIDRLSNGSLSSDVESLRTKSFDIRKFIGKSTEHTKSTNCLKSTTRLLMILMLGNVDKGIVQQLRFQHFQKMNLNRISVLVEKNVQPLRFLTRKRVQILESNRNSLFDEETVQQLRLPIGKSFQRKESNQNSVLDSEFSCYFEPMVNVKRHGSNEEYYNFDQEENKNQENIKRTDHDPKGEDSNMEDMFCEIETEKVGHLQETTEGHKFIESVSEVDHGKKLIDHSSNFDCEVGDIDGDHEFFYAMERSETEIDEINYERSTTSDVYSNETIILTDLLHSTPVDGDHEFFDAMERSEIDEINYERSTANDVYSNETIIPTDLLHSTPVMFSNEMINLKDLSRSTPVEGNHLSTKKSIHEETNVKRLVCNDTTCSLDEDNLMRVELEDLEDLSVDEFNITQDNDIGSRNVFDYIRNIEIEEDGKPFCRNTKLEDDDEPFCRNTKSTSIDRYSNRVWSLPDYHIIPELNKDYQVIPELNKGDISNTSMKSDSEFASNSLKNGSDNGSLLSSCSCNVDAHVFNCQVVIPHSFVNDSNNDMQSSRTVIDIQKCQKSKSHARIVDSKKKPLLKGMINENVPTTEDVCRIVRNIIETTNQKSISNLTKKSCRKCFSSYRKKPRRRLTRRRLRRLIYPHRNISHVHVDIEARPLLNASERNATTNGPGNGLNNVEAAALATSQRCLTTSLPSSSNSLNNYFSKLLSGYEFSTDEKMQFEMIRVQSFQDLPASCSVSPLRLARTGFFSSGSGDEVTCFSCGVKYKGWQNNDNPNDVHRRISSDCRMVNGRETRNIPVSQQHNGIIEHSGQQESLAHTTNDFAQSTVHFDGDVSTQTTEPTQNREMTREEVVKSNFSDNIQQSTNIKPPVDQPYSRQPALDRTNPDQQYASSVPDQNRPAQSAEDLGINLDKPKYPAYAQLNVRVSTFQGWPGYLDQTPRDMALAGFFYAGYNDYCRCFFCGGGLRNWDSGDDPWVEHTRWFPKCVFVQQNRGRRFVEIIVKRQAEMQASGNSVGNTKNQRAIKTQIGTGERSETSSQTSSQSADSNSTIDPAKASVRELGYADEIIDRAITIIKQNNPSKQKIEATDIMEVIFTITEDSETNTAVASENTPSSELNLPSTSQAVPQSNVSSQSNQPMSHSSQSNKPLVSKPNQPTAVASQSTNASENSLPSLSVSSLEHGNAAAVKSTSKEISENEIRSLQEENIQLKEQVMCKICMDKNVSIAFLPCGHLACCIDCAPAMRKCPMCRVYIKGTVKTFLA